ncbi:unnamed protein product [Caenorhabditis bovis]|uniref:VWFA domain-containing protein n=1 Tax=Caenorhabditis bovis TaxID=2654633 RepID=A0A8S1F155_9PELO|nr:unnamed protein product [Caenorhabditis bovis]
MPNLGPSIRRDSLPDDRDKRRFDALHYALAAAAVILGILAIIFIVEILSLHRDNDAFLNRVTATMSVRSANAKPWQNLDWRHYVLAATTILFLILFIIFVSLYATYNPKSSAFLVVGNVAQQSAKFSNLAYSDQDVQNELRGILSKKYNLDSFNMEVSDGVASAVYSVRGTVKQSDMAKTVQSSKTISNPKTTTGSAVLEACNVAVPICPQSTVSPASSQATSTVKPPPISNGYCAGYSVVRDILIVFDMDVAVYSDADAKSNTIRTIAKQLAAGVTFPSTQVFIAAVASGNVVSISQSWITDSATLTADIEKAISVENQAVSTILPFKTINDYAMDALQSRPATAQQVIVITDKLLNDVSCVDLRNYGVYFGLIGIGAKRAQAYTNYVDKAIIYDSWAAVSQADPMATLVCSYYSSPKKRLEGFGVVGDASNNPRCETIDILIAFDTSESLSRIILKKYRSFAEQFVAQYKYEDDLFTRIAIMTFNSDVSKVLDFNANLTVIDNAIESVAYTGGLTDVTKMLKTANDYFLQHGVASRGKVLLLLSDATPTLDSFDDEIAAGQTLAKNGVSVFFNNYETYSPDIQKKLEKVTDPRNIFTDLSPDTLNALTQRILVVYPCPVPKCVTAYFAVEFSEPTSNVLVQNLQTVLKIADQDAALQSGAESYQLISYNENHTQFKPDNTTLAGFKAYVQSLIDDDVKRKQLIQGNTRLDMAINDISAVLYHQATINKRATSNILFFGQANNGVLDPNVSIDVKKKQLQDASAVLRAVTTGIYVVDDSRNPTLFGEDLWTSVTGSNNIVALGGDVIGNLTNNTDYFVNWSKMSCELPKIESCKSKPIDMAIIFDLPNRNDALVNYTAKFASQFSTENDAHMAMLAYGINPTMFLTDLGAHNAQDLQDSIVKLEEWRNGSLFQTTPAPAPTQAFLDALTQNIHQAYTVQPSTINRYSFL